MLTERRQLAAQAIARLDAADREAALRRGFITINVSPAHAIGIWSPINLDLDILAAAEQIRREYDSAQRRNTVPL
jgi:hypothetical protein